ncbi:MAG: hypothetical protein Q7T61_15560 [Caulobacter sp.]|nr:hypothetical protein [Caulobacter sp.]
MLPSFHDGYLTGLAVSEGAATLSFLRSDGARWRVDLSGVRYLKADEFRQGNIVFALEVVSDAEESRALLEAHHYPLGATAAQGVRDALVDREINLLVDQIALDALVLVSLSASYGCEMIVVCKTAEGKEVG